MKWLWIVLLGIAQISSTATAEFAAPVITNLNINGNRLAVGVSSENNVMLTLETTDSLTGGEWKPLTTSYATNSGTLLDDYPFTGESSAYYRVRIDAPSAVNYAAFRGWAGAVHLSNDLVTATVVPEIGRIMDFGFSGSNGVFWADRALDGHPASSWPNFGGDKAWPAPQSNWGWPPPTGFDGSSYAISDNGAEVVLRSPVDATFGIQVTRCIRLIPNEPIMRVTTIFEQITGVTNDVSIWVVTQMQSPERMFFPVADNSILANGWQNLGKPTPPDLVVSNNLVSFSRDTLTAHKVGADSDRLLWIGSDACLEMTAPRIAGETYPDNESSVEIYTKQGEDNYIELELLGPMTELRPGESVSYGINYTLHPRILIDPQLEAEAIFGL